MLACCLAGRRSDTYGTPVVIARSTGSWSHDNARFTHSRSWAGCPAPAINYGHTCTTPHQLASDKGDTVNICGLAIGFTRDTGIACDNRTWARWWRGLEGQRHVADPLARPPRATLCIAVGLRRVSISTPSVNGCGTGQIARFDSVVDDPGRRAGTTLGSARLLVLVRESATNIRGCCTSWLSPRSLLRRSTTPYAPATATQEKVKVP